MARSIADPPDPIATYRERFPGLRREFELFPDKASVRGKWKGNPFQAIVPLGQLDPEYGYTMVRPLRPLLSVISLILSGVLLLGVVAGGAPVMSAAVFLPAALIVGVLGLTAYYFPRVRIYRFVNTSGLNVLDVFESGPECDQAKAFVESVAATIRDRRAFDPALPHAGAT